jgi:hypothetical protein
MTKSEKPADQAALPQTPDPADIFAGQPATELDPSDRAGGTSAPGTKFYGIAQSQGGNVQKIQNAGQFYTKNEDGELEFYSTLDVVILDAGPRSTRFEDDHVACKSYDGKVGLNGQSCKTCQYNYFTENNIPKDQKCKNSRILLCVPADDWNAEPFFFQISPSGIKDWQKYATELQNRYKRPVFSVITRISTVARKENKGVAYVPVFTPKKALEAEEIKALREIRIAESYRFKAPDDETSNGTAVDSKPVGNGDFIDPFNEE